MGTSINAPTDTISQGDDITTGSISASSDVSIFDDNNNADTKLTIGTSATECLEIQCLNGSSNKTAEEILFNSKTASSTSHHGKMTFGVDESNKLEINDDGISITGSITTNTITHSGAISLNSSGGVINIGNDAVAQNINLGTGSAARTITLGNITGATTLALNSGTGGITLTSTGSGDIIINSDDTLLLDSDGVLELNSSGGEINIGNDQVAQPINIGCGTDTDAGRTMTIGNTHADTTLTLNSGTSGIILDGGYGGDTNVIIMSALPTSDPTTSGQLWNDSGTVKVSAGE